MKVWEALAKKNPMVTITPRETLAGAIRHLVEARIRALPVVDGAKLVGIVTTLDILWNLDARGASALEESVDKVMTRDVVTVDRDAALEDIERTFVERGIGHIPVLEQGKLVGLLTPADVFGCHLDDVQWLHDNLHSYVYGGVR